MVTHDIALAISMADINPVISLNANGLSKHSNKEIVILNEKAIPYHMLPRENSFYYKNTNSLTITG